LALLFDFAGFEQFELKSKVLLNETARVHGD